MPAITMNQLCLQIAESDDELAFGELFKLYYPRLLLFAEAILKSREPAEEAVEDVFLKLWENRKVLPAINNINYYLLVAAKHKALDYLEKMKKHAVIRLEDVQVEFGDIAVNPEDSLISAESVRIIQAIINGLPPRCKLMFRLVKEDGLKYREVADLLNISVKTVETQMSLALSKIGAALQTRMPSDNRLYRSGGADK
ncbi:MAG TPA: RNA polymerase sigma-70 factor [Puia sp.]|nr:RNA polymerase sigma-70 factor [Puia sp.]